MMPVYEGRFWGSTMNAMITYPPVAMPAQPMPATARPAISASALGAAPHSTLPISNRTMEARKVCFRSKYLYALPHDA